MIRFGIISFAHVHAPGYANVLRMMEQKYGNVELVAIADENKERLEENAKRFKVKHTFVDYKEMLYSNLIDAVIITSENTKHSEQVIEAAKAGKHVVCEKPLATTLEDLIKMRDSIRNSGIVFQTAFPVRYSSPVASAKKALSDLGKIRAINATNHGRYPGGWFGIKELGGGAILDHTVHVADLIRYFSMDEFETVRAYWRKNIRKELKVEDNALIYAKLKSGIPVAIDTSWSRHLTWPIWGDVFMEILTEKGYIKLDVFAPHIDLADTQKFSWIGYGEDQNELMLLDFMDSINRRKKPLTDFEAGAKAALVAIYALESVNRGSIEIKLPEVDMKAP